MAHPDDLNCPDCGDPHLYYSALGYRTPLPHACRKKPPRTAEEGVAAFGGLLGMAEAIRRNYLCYNCGRHTGPMPMVEGKFGTLFRCTCWAYDDE